MYNEALLETLIQKVYDAAAGLCGWESFLVGLGDALDSRYPTLYFVDPVAGQGSLALSVGMDQKCLHSYRAYYHKRNVWLRGATARDLLRPGNIRLSSDTCSRRDFLRSEWYADFCRPRHLGQSLAVTVLQDRTLTSNISVSADEHRPPYGGEELALVRGLLPHLQRGFAMHARLAASQAQGKALGTVLDALASPVLLVTAEGAILYMNAAAEHLIRASDGLAVKGGGLQALLPDETRALRNLVAGAAATSARQGRKSGGTLRVSRPCGRGPLDILISPLPSAPQDWALWKPPVAAIFVTDRSRMVVSEHSLLIRLYGLTAMEAKVVVAVSQGLSGKEICRELEIRYNTLKTHLKHVYAKTHTRHQTDLVRVLAAGERLTGDDPAGAPMRS